MAELPDKSIAPVEIASRSIFTYLIRERGLLGFVRQRCKHGSVSKTTNELITIVDRQSPITHGLIFFTFTCAFSAEAFAIDMSYIIAVAAFSPLRKYHISSVAKYCYFDTYERDGNLAACDKYLVRRSEALASRIFFKHVCALCWHCWRSHLSIK